MVSEKVTRLYAIDPGPEKSALLVYDLVTRTPCVAEIMENRALITFLLTFIPMAEVSAVHSSEPFKHHLAIEMVAHYGSGMAVGASVFDSCVWIGRFIQAAHTASNIAHTMVYRKDVKMVLCQDTRAKGKNIRQALIDRFPPTGGGKVPQIGTKKQPGPLYGIKSHLWAALAVAVTWQDMREAYAQAEP